MNVTRAQVPQREQYLAQIDRLLNSHVLHGSESLCKLLRYLAEHALDHPGTPLKEYQIATEVFGRSPNFDPQSDSTIRVQAGRLRLKLAEYYASEGADEPISGTEGHLRGFVSPPQPTARQQALSHFARLRELERKKATSGPGPRARGRWRLALAYWWRQLRSLHCLLMTRSTRRVGAGQHRTGPGAFTTFWKGFVVGPEEPG